MTPEQDSAPEDPFFELCILSVTGEELEDGSYRVTLHTSDGDILGLLHPSEGYPGAVIFVGGALGGLDGPADRVYARLGRGLVGRGVTSLRLHYRQPGEFPPCVLDVLVGVSFLKGIGAQKVVLVGHSFGGAVVIKAGELSDLVVAVAALSSQLHGASTVDRLSPKPLLLVHGMDDQVLEAVASQEIYDHAREPKRLVLYPGAGHALYECRQEIYDLLMDWIPQRLNWQA